MPNRKMVSIRITDSGEFLDTEGVRLAYSLQAFDLTELSNRKGEFSIDFELPDTPPNRKKLSYATEDFLSANTTYKRINVEILQNGQLVKAGYLRIVQRAEKINATFYSGASDWISRLTGSIKDVDLSDFDHTFTNANIQAGLIKEDQFIYPLIDYGFLNTVQGIAGDPMDELDLRPAVFMRDLLIIMFREIAWKIDGDLIDDFWFKRLIIPFSLENFNHGQEWINERVLNIKKSTSQSRVGAADTIDSYDPSGRTSPSNFNVPNGQYTPDETMKATIKLTANFSVVGANTTLDIDVNGAAVASEAVTGVGEFAVEFTVPIFLSIAQPVEGVIRSPADAWTITSASLKIVDIEEITEGATIQLAATLPDISKGDLMKYIFIHRGCYPISDNFSKTLTIGFFKDIKNNAQDEWSSKVNFKKVDFSALFQNYAQATRFKYLTSDNDTQLLAYKESNEGVHFGDGAINIDNDFLPVEVDFYESPFAGTVNISTLKGRSDMPLLSLPISPLSISFQRQKVLHSPIIGVSFLAPKSLLCLPFP